MNHSQGTIECIKANTHVWTGTTSGWWCRRCRMFVSDQLVMQLRKDGLNLPIEELLRVASEKEEKWITTLHFWSMQGAEDL